MANCEWINDECRDNKKE